MFEEMKKKIRIAENVYDCIEYRYDKCKETLSKEPEDDYDRACQDDAKLELQLLEEIKKVLVKFVG